MFYGISIPSTEMENSEEASFKENWVYFGGKRVENSVDDRISEIEISIGESLACVWGRYGYSSESGRIIFE